MLEVSGLSSPVLGFDKYRRVRTVDTISELRQPVLTTSPHQEINDYSRLI